MKFVHSIVNFLRNPRKVLRYVGIAVVALVTFVFALQMTFPYDRVRDKLVDAMAKDYEVTIGSVERGWMPGRVYFNALSIRTRAKPNEPTTTFYIEKLEVDLGILALLGGRASVDLDAKIGAGHIAGNISVGKSGTSVHVTGKDLPGASLPMRAVLGLPMTGKIEFAVALDLPNRANKAGKVGPDWSKAEGSVELGCPTGCTFGDGKTRLRPLLKNQGQQAMVGEGIDFGQVNIDSLLVKAELTPSPSDSKPGKLKLDTFDAKSHDGELHVDYAMDLERDLQESTVTGCLRFKGTPELLKREPRTFAAIQTTGAELRGDGLFHIKLTDKFKDMKRLNLECGPNVHDDQPGIPRPNVRPNLAVMPDEPVRPTPVPAVAAPSPPPPPAPPPGDAGVEGRGGAFRAAPVPEGEASPAGSGSSGSAPPPSAPQQPVPQFN